MVRLGLSGAKRYRERPKGLLNRGVVYQNRDYNTKRSKVTVGSRGKRGGLQNYRYAIQRWQAASPSYLGPGYYRLGAWAENPTSTQVPIHFMSLTNLAEHAIAGNVKGCFGDVGMCRVIMDSGGNFGWQPLACQDNNGNLTDAQWKVEQDDGTLGEVSLARSVYHDWTDIRLNLYGTFSVPVTYTIYVMRMKEQLDPFQYSFGSGAPPGNPPYYPFDQGSEGANMFKDMVRSLVGNSVNTNGRTDWVKDVSIVRKFRITLQPLSYSDQAAELAADQVAHTPNIHEFRLFLRHNRFRDYKWSENAFETTEAVDLTKNQWDVNNPTTTMSDVEWGKRLFLFVTATAPGIGSIDPSQLATSETARTQGSYDVNVRNKFRWQN